MENALLVKLSNVQRSELISYYTGKIADMNTLIAEYQDLLDQLKGNGDRPINDSSFNVVQDDLPPAADYRKNWSWSAKIRYVLRLQGHCLTSREIVEKIEELEPD